MRRAALSLTLLALACELEAPPDLLPDEPPAPLRRTLVRSCPADARPTSVVFDPRRALGEVGGVTWLFGQAGDDPVLAHLSAEDTLALTKIPLPGVQVGAIEGTRIWLYAPHESGEAPARWLSVDVADPDRPIPGEVVPLTTSARMGDAVALAVSDQRVLLVTGAREARELVLLDTATRAAITPPHALPRMFDPVHTTCEADRCAVIAITVEPTSLTPSLVIVRVLADGALEQEPLAPAWMGSSNVVDQGDQLIALWLDDGGLLLRVLDRTGNPRGPAVPVPWDSNRWIRRATLLDAGGAVMLAIGEQDRWSVATVGPHATVGPLRPLPGANLEDLRGAPIDDGLAWLGLGLEVRHGDEESIMMTHSWRAEAVGGFLPTSGEPAPAQPVASASGDGRGHFESHILVRPGAAAALLVPRDDNHDATVLTPLRSVCPASRPVIAALGSTVSHTQGELVASIVTTCKQLTATWRGPAASDDALCGS